MAIIKIKNRNSDNCMTILCSESQTIKDVKTLLRESQTVENDKILLSFNQKLIMNDDRPISTFIQKSSNDKNNCEKGTVKEDDKSIKKDDVHILEFYIENMEENSNPTDIQKENPLTNNYIIFGDNSRSKSDLKDANELTKDQIYYIERFRKLFRVYVKAHHYATSFFLGFSRKRLFTFCLIYLLYKYNFSLLAFAIFAKFLNYSCYLANKKRILGNYNPGFILKSIFYFIFSLIFIDYNNIFMKKSKSKKLSSHPN